MSVHHLYRSTAIPPTPKAAGSWWATDAAQTRDGLAKLLAEAQRRLSGVSDPKAVLIKRGQKGTR
jgi:hypothetical protein